jgi:hypothetical protein
VGPGRVSIDTLIAHRLERVAHAHGLQPSGAPAGHG